MNKYCETAMKKYYETVPKVLWNSNEKYYETAPIIASITAILLTLRFCWHKDFVDARILSRPEFCQCTVRTVALIYARESTFQKCKIIWAIKVRSACKASKEVNSGGGGGGGGGGGRARPGGARAGAG